MIDTEVVLYYPRHFTPSALQVPHIFQTFHHSYRLPSSLMIGVEALEKNCG